MPDGYPATFSTPLQIRAGFSACEKNESIKANGILKIIQQIPEALLQGVWRLLPT